MSLRVLITGSTPRIGLSFQFVPFAQWLQAQGVSMIVTGCDGEATPGLFKALEDSGIPFHDLPDLQRTGLPQLLRPSGGLARLLDETRPDIAIITAAGHLAEVPLIRGRKPKVVWWQQSVRNTKFYAGLARRLAARIANRHSDQTWMQCEIERRHMVAAGLRDEFVHLVPSPIFFEWWETHARAPLAEIFAPVTRAKAEGRRILVYPASLLPGKRHDLLFRALVEVKKRHPKLLLCCPGRFGSERLQPLVSRLGLKDDVMFTNAMVPQEAIPPLLAAADLAVFTSQSETYGKALIEALCLGVPTVTTRVGVACEAEAANAAVVCDIGDVSAIAAAMTHLLEDDAARTALSERARAWAREQTYPAVGFRVLELLNALAADRPNPVGASAS